MRNEQRYGGRGFTLIELMVVTAVIAIIAAIGLPNLLSSRLTANESAAISTLRAIVSAQAQAGTRAAVDVDGDGRGEYLYLAELSGTVNLRGTAAPLDPAIISLSLGMVLNSAVNKSGYFYAMYLPDAAGAGVAEDPAGGKAVPLAVEPDLCETFWVAYAWPSTFENTGRRTFCVNQTGSVMQTANDVQQYEGVGAGGTVPAADAAYSAAGDMTANLSISGTPAPAADGGVWLPVN